MSSPSFRNLVRKYLEDMQNTYRTSIKSGQVTPELSYRPAVDSLLRSLPKILGIDSVGVVYEPRKQHASGRPDWRFHHTRSMGVFGYVEAKDFCPGSKITWREHKKQVVKYLAVGHSVVLTDGIDFLFFNPDNPDHPLKVSILNKPLDPDIDWSKTSISGRLEIAFLDFFKEPRARIISEDDLMLELAARARNLFEDVLNLVSLGLGEGIDELENRTIAALKNLKSLLQSEHDPELRSDERFSKTVAQILIFGLFYAHRHLAGGKPNPSDLAASLHRFWTRPISRDKVNRLRPFRALADVLVRSDRELSAINLWYADCILFLSHVRLLIKQQKEPDYHFLYEKFLSCLDPKDRIDFGAYATPWPLAKYVISFCNAIAKNKFRSSLYSSKNKIVDPCCGTGTFLEGILKSAQKIGVRTGDFPKLAGFEILPAPYTLSQYRLTQLHLGGNPHAKDVVVALCNTLSDFVTKNNWPWRSQVSTPSDSIFAQAKRLLREERDEATRLAKPPITLIIGNPPSSDAGLHTNRQTCGTILRLIDDFRPPSSLRTRRQNIQKQMQNDFVKFLRWGCHKLSTQNPGILAFILPSAFLQHISYTFARKWLLDNFSNVWVLEFDSDARIGAPTSNLFPTLQGRCVVFCSKSGKINSTQTIKYRSILGFKKEQKSLFFGTASENMKTEDSDSEFEEVTPTKSGYYKFKPQITYNKTNYSAFWSVASKSNKLSKEKFIFARHSSGIKLGITSAFVSPDLNILSRRIQEISSLDVSFASLEERWFSGQKKPPRIESLTPSVRDAIRLLIKRKGPRWRIKKYSFRPFLNMYAFLPEELLKSLARVGGGGTRYRPEVMAAFSDPKNFGISIAPAPADIGESIQRFATFSWYIPDNDLCARGNAHVFCHLFPEYKPRGEWNRTPVPNINAVLIKSLIKRGANPKTVAADIVFYTYAVLVSNAYLKHFEGVLYTTAGDWPKIPFPTDIRCFEKISVLGRQLAELEILDKLPLLPENSQFSKLEKTHIRLKKYSIEPNPQTITLTDQEDRTYLLKDIDRDCLLYRVSGYPVIAEWLKRHSFPYLRRAIGYQDFSNLHRLILSLKLQLKLIQKIDQEVDKLIQLKKGKLL